MNRVAIIGLGMMGGSLGLALKARGRVKVAGYVRSPDKARSARRKGVADEVFTSMEKVVQDADLVVFCTPILAMPGLLKDCKPLLKKGSLVTDVGSTKVFLSQELGGILKDNGSTFVGSHPMAGSEQEGIAASRADLYRGATVVITPARGTASSATDAIRDFWKQLGSHVYEMEAREHDRIVARTSHLPHMLASILTMAVARSGGLDQLSAYCGTGFRDTTRVAEGSPAVWHDILRTNRTNVAEELRAARMQVDQMLKILDEGDFESLQRYLEKARAARVDLLGKVKTTSK